jgi:hypothetical protein
MTGPVGAVLPRLHLPDEPVFHRLQWRDRVLGGEDIADVVTGPGGVAGWFWGRWRVLAASGINEAGLTEIVRGYRREIWLWLAGERTWAQCCAGLVGRIERRTPAAH